jgi:hypothetical protein
VRLIICAGADAGAGAGAGADNGNYCRYAVIEAATPMLKRVRYPLSHPKFSGQPMSLGRYMRDFLLSLIFLSLLGFLARWTAAQSANNQ